MGKGALPDRMDSFLLRYKNSLVLAMLLLLQTIGLAIQVRRPAETRSDDGHKVTLARSWVVAVVAPVERLVHSTGLVVRSTWANYLDLRHTRDQNLALQRELDELRIQQAAIAEDAIQGHRLQALLAFQQHYVSATVAAQVIGTSGTDLSRVLYIDKGAADGLKPDMAVITPDGIVGKVRDVFPGTAPHVAQVLLINDQTSGAGVELVKTRMRAVIHGTTGGGLQIGNLTGDDRIQPGEQVVTSGGDQIFPRGLPVGVVEAIQSDPEHPPYVAIRVKPAANLSRLEEVLVVTGTEPSLPVAALDRLAQGAKQTAEARAAAQKAAAAQAAEQLAKQQEARSAAEVMSDRLPSVQDPNETEAQREADAKAAAAASPSTAGSAVPAPLPALREDRYSPGATPPASRLTPGGGDAPAEGSASSAGSRGRAAPGGATEGAPE